MRKIAIIPAEHVHELKRRLEEASIECSETPEGFGGALESPDAALPLENTSVWVNERDLELASQIAAHHLEEVETRIAKAKGAQSKCRACGYDLRGHSMRGKCPECASPFEL